MKKLLDKTIFAFALAITTYCALFMVYDLYMYLYNIFGMMTVYATIPFIVLWGVWYVIISKD